VFAEHVGVKMQTTEDLAVLSNELGDMKRTNDLVAALNEERSRNAELESELEKLLDDVDRFQYKLDKADDAIDELLLENKKLKFKVDNQVSRKKEYDDSKLELEEVRSKTTDQQRIIYEEEQCIEEQDFLIRSLEHDLDQKIKEEGGNSREHRLSAGRKSYHGSVLAKKDATIASLQAEMEGLQESMGPEGAKKLENEALQKIEKLEAEKEEMECDISCLKESHKDLNKKMKQAELKESTLSSKSNLTSERAWKRKAEMLAELRVQSYIMDPENSSELPEVPEDAPQALLLQSAITRKKQEKHNNSWGLVGIWASRKHATDDFGAMFTKGSTKVKKDTGHASLTTNGDSVSMFSGGNHGVTDDPNDVEAIKEINQKLKEANRTLQKSFAHLEKGRRKEDVFNQKLIVKLQRDNEKLLKKLDGFSRQKDGSSSKGWLVSDSLKK
jgi:hypothetical protein